MTDAKTLEREKIARAHLSFIANLPGVHPQRIAQIHEALDAIQSLRASGTGEGVQIEADTIQRAASLLDSFVATGNDVSPQAIRGLILAMDRKHTGA